MDMPIPVSATCSKCDADLTDTHAVEVTARYAGALAVRDGYIVARPDSETVDSEVSCASCGAILEVRETEWT